MSVHDLLIGPVWLAVNLMMVAAAWRMSHLAFVRDRLLTHVLHTTVLCCACVLATSILLGVMGVLSAPSLLIGVGLLSGLGWALLAKARHQRRQRRPAVNSLPAGAVRDGETRRKRPVSKQAGDRIWVGVWWVVIALYLGHMIEGGILALPSHWDALSYHMPYVDHWLAANSLYIPDCARWADPANNELLGLWMVAPFSGDFLIALNNLPAFIILVLATVMLMDTLGVSPLVSNLGALVVASNYAVMRQATDPGNDVAVAAYFLAGVGYALRYFRERRHGDLVLASLCVGVLGGIKYYALGYAGLVALLLMSVMALRRFRSARSVVITGALCLLVFSGYWYARNVWISGTPIYPMGLTAETDAVSQYRTQQYGAPHVWSSTLAGNPNPEVVPLTFSAIWRMTGPGHVTALLLTPAVLLYLLCTGSVIRRLPGGRFRGTSRLFVAGLTIASGVLWVITPYAAETIPGTLNMAIWGYCPVRFGLSFLALALVSLLVVIDDLTLARWSHQRHPRAGGQLPARFYVLRCCLPVVLLLVSGFQLSRPLIRDLDGDLLGALIFGADIAIIGALLALAWRAWPRFRYLALPAALTMTGVLAGLAGDRWHRKYAGHFDRWSGTKAFTALATMPADEVRICACIYRYYPFFGSERQFYVCRPEWVRSPRALFEYIHDRNVTHVAASRRTEERQRYDEVDTFLQRIPEVFALTDEGRLFTMYRVDRTKLEQMLASGPGQAETSNVVSAGAASSLVTLHPLAQQESAR
ncbi:MAG: hypothetical protein HQ582_34775 [Planctomycetes bacterium]|nr:hypothetical protein [Planctomycetota bacterium]